VPDASKEMVTMCSASPNDTIKARISPAIEDYLKAIYTLQLANSQVTTSLLAEHIGVKPA
jgi:iron dependent repressor-like protein